MRLLRFLSSFLAAALSVSAALISPLSASAALSARAHHSSTAAPVILMNPSDAASLSGGTITLESKATVGSAQWFVSNSHGASWTPVSKATKSELVVKKVALSHSGDEYRVVYSNHALTAVSSPATITVVGDTLPYIVQSPTSRTMVAGSSIKLSASALSKRPLKIQWWTSHDAGATWSPIAGAVSPLYFFAPASIAASGTQFKVTFANSWGIATTSVATVQVLAPAGSSAPAITAQPRSQSVIAGNSATFTVTITGSPTPTVSWVSKSPGSDVWTTLTSSSGASFTFSAPTTDQSGTQVRAVVSNVVGSATSDSATLTVLPVPDAAPVIVTPPLDATATAGFATTFSAVVTGSPLPTMQWRVSTDDGVTWNDIAGAHSENYQTDPSTYAMQGDLFEIEATNRAGTVVSSPAVLHVTTSQIAWTQNWAAYVATGDAFTSASGDWVVPTTTCGSGNSYTSEWVGIDGVGSSTVEQTGTEVVCRGSSVQYDAWWEMYGDQTALTGGGFEMQLGTDAYPVAPGDHFHASIAWVGGEWTLELDNLTAGWNFSQLVPDTNPPLARSSAEWVVERRQNCIGWSCSVGNLAATSPVTFSNISVSSANVTGTITNFTVNLFKMWGDQTQGDLADPGFLSRDGSSFTVTNNAPVI